jgi:hypothetical protein
MTKQVKHLQVYKPAAFGGVVNTTICGRVRNNQDYNVADSREDVTCSYCKQLIKENAPILKWEGYQPA